MATAPLKTAKAIAQEEKDIKDQLDTQTNFIPSNNLNAPKHGTVIPNRVFVGGISSATTESDLMALFSNYGTVTGAKIIADRAGVSKGYGFVTFETEEEAKRLQKDADNIMLRERRLNIAPAIKKQGYGRAPSYECPATPVPMPAQVYRQNGGVPFTFHNGMAFFPQPTHQPMTPGHIETPGVYQQGTHYVPQGSPAAAYQYPYTQGQVIYQAAPQYPSYQMPYEGCYESGLMMHEANLVVPPYYLAPPEGITYYQPAPMHPQDLNPHLSHPIMFPSPQRTFDSSIVYPTEPSTDSDTSQVQIQEVDTSAANTVTTTSANLQTSNQEITTTSSSNETILRRGKEFTPVVSLLKLNTQKEVNSNGKPYYQHQNNYNSQPSYQMRRKPRFEEVRRVPHLNNNTPEMANRNLIHYQQHQQQGGPPRGSRRGSGASGDDSSHYPIPNPTPRPSLPSYPYYTRQTLPHPSPSNSQHPFFHHPPPPHRSRSFFNRPRFGGGGGRGGGGRGGYHSQHQRSGMEGIGGKYGKEEEGGSSQPLTPPITPKSDSGRATTPASQHQQTEELVKSIQAVAI